MTDHIFKIMIGKFLRYISKDLLVRARILFDGLWTPKTVVMEIFKLPGMQGNHSFSPTSVGHTSLSVIVHISS